MLKCALVGRATSAGMVTPSWTPRGRSLPQVLFLTFQGFGGSPRPRVVWWSIGLQHLWTTLKQERSASTCLAWWTNERTHPTLSLAQLYKIFRALNGHELKSLKCALEAIRLDIPNSGIQAAYNFFSTINASCALQDIRGQVLALRNLLKMNKWKYISMLLCCHERSRVPSTKSDPWYL